MASYDCIALDVVASELIGIDPIKVPTNRAAISRVLGQSVWRLLEYLWPK